MAELLHGAPSFPQLLPERALSHSTLGVYVSAISARQKGLGVGGGEESGGVGDRFLTSSPEIFPASHEAAEMCSDACAQWSSP